MIISVLPGFRLHIEDMSGMDGRATVRDAAAAESPVCQPD